MYARPSVCCLFVCNEKKKKKLKIKVYVLVHGNMSYDLNHVRVHNSNLEFYIKWIVFIVSVTGKVD